MSFDSLFNFFLRLDGPVFAWFEAALHPGSNGFLDFFFPLVTRLGNGGVFWILLALALAIPKRTRKAAVVMILALLLDVIITNGILKVLFERPRPYDFNWAGTGWDFEYLKHVAHTESDFSFPSGHTGVSFAGALGLLLGARPEWVSKHLRKFAWVMVALAAVIGFSRIYIGVHYATDVLGGVVVGAICATLALLLFRLAEPLFDRLNRALEANIAKLRAKRKKA
ncbi:MAG: phosphatase PAP2 family protein [Oscillospiraceae bacterium]|jgi:undecaprenyl-diphosphatase|nr:phosphatase PAP2 family protein [Oscillospiraceae bacterium]